MPGISLAGEVRRFLKERIGEGDMVIDATVGNGHDALFMAMLIGESGRLYGFDIQPEALAATANRLAASHVARRATLFLHSHATMASVLPEGVSGHVSCIMFNLGDLPGSDKSLSTDAESTRSALKQAVDLLSPGGVISILACRGHPSGEDEYHAITRWLESLPAIRYSVAVRNLLPDHRLPPVWITVEKRTAL